MSLRNISLGLAVYALFALPFSADAYFTTGQIAGKINESAALFAIEYTFGLEDRDMYMPVLAERTLSSKSERNKVGYTIRNSDGEEVTDGTAVGLVLSGAPLVNGMYKLEKGDPHEMTLLIIYIAPEGSTEEDYALKIDWLPFEVDRGSKARQELQLNPSELEYYTTKAVELNASHE